MNCLYQFNSATSQAEQEALGVAADMQAQHQAHVHALPGPQQYGQQQQQQQQQLSGYTLTGSSPTGANAKRDQMFMVSSGAD